MPAKLIDLLTEGHELYFPPLVEAMEVNADFAAVIERAIQIEKAHQQLYEVVLLFKSELDLATVMTGPLAEKILDLTKQVDAAIAATRGTTL